MVSKDTTLNGFYKLDNFKFPEDGLWYHKPLDFINWLPSGKLNILLLNIAHV
jgi:hypothetical protein